MSDPINEAHAAAARKYPALHLYIDGKWADGNGTSIPVIDPTLSTLLGDLPAASEADLDRAIAAAARSFNAWRTTAARERSRLLRNAAGWLRAQRTEWAALIALELGKPLPQALLETDTACEMFEWAAEEARRLYGREIPSRSAKLRMTATLEPIGPVAALSGWNAPAITPARKIAGALGAGCTIVLKASEATPASALMIARAFEAAGLPPGVLNIVFGDPVFIAARFAASSAIRMITFTGATAVGKRVAALGAATLKRMVLELGGHAPLLVFDDVDVDAVASAAVAAKYRNGGQVCTSPTRILVQERVYDRFVERFVASLREVIVADPFAAGSQMGPLQNARRVAAIRELAQDAAARGARIEWGTAPQGGGFWQAPGILLDCPDDSRVAFEEPFGPLGLIRKFSSVDAAIAEANRLPFGLAAYAFTDNLRISERLAREVQSGTLAINHWVASFPETPFGGLKDSGVGSEGGSEGLAEFTQRRFVSVLA